MLPAMNAFPKPRFVDAKGVRLAIYEQGTGFPVVLVHGWPEIAYSWKSQIPAIAGAGFRAIAPDLKGFGRSDAPKEASAYGIGPVTDDLARMLDALGIDRAVFCGHDWGGLIVWPMAVLHPDRVAGIIGVCTPHLAPQPTPPTQLLTERFGANHYIVRFQKDGEAEACFTGREDAFFEFMFRGPVPRAVWPKLIPGVFDVITHFNAFKAADPAHAVMPAADRAVYAEAYRRSGFTGGINLYRNIDANAALLRGKDMTIRKPCLFVGAELDMFLPIEIARAMPGLVPDLETHILNNCGHWVMWEKPAELNALMTDWLKRRFGES